VTYDTILMVDWSGAPDQGPRPKADAIWACVAGDDPIYFRSRQAFEDWVTLISRSVIRRDLQRRLQALVTHLPYGLGSQITSWMRPSRTIALILPVN